MRGRYTALSLLALGAGLAAGIFGERYYLNTPVSDAETGPEILYWVAPMDANFRRDVPGKSPMGMDLIPVYAGDEPSGDPAEVQLSAAEINAIGVRTALARIDPLSERIETVGFVGYDEHLTSHVHTRVEGWIEELSVRAIGDRVAKGDLLFEMFSAEIGSSSFDLVRAIESGERRIIDLARGKLRSQGVSEQQIDEIAETGTIARNLRVYAPRDGVVISLDAADGMFLKPDTRALSVTDLSSVWLIVDVFERDMARLSEDMTAIARFEHLNGQTFEGQIEYVYPELDPETRTLPVRLRFDNAEGLLKPNMFGSVDLSPTETREAVTVPNEAVIRTGRAERVILKTGEGTFKPRLIATGLRDTFGAGGRTEVVQGLAPGEEIVVSAQFLIDSESALSAGLMRLAPTDAAPASGTGTLVALDRTERVATVRHDALASLDWPAMTSQFPVRADVALDRLSEGQVVAFKVARGADGMLGVIELGADDGIAATGTGVVEAVTPDGKLAMRHEPIPELGWPAMEMDMPVAGFDPQTAPVGQTVQFDLSKGDDGMFVIVAVRADGMTDMATGDAMPAPEVGTPPATEDAAPPIVVSGQITAVNADDRMATISHGPIAETGMPGMTMDFALAETLDAGSLVTDAEMTLTFARPDGMTMVLTAAEAATPPMKVEGTINSVDAEAGRANITHGPMTEIGMPGMTMDFAISDEIPAETLPVGEKRTLLMDRNADFSLTLVGIAAGAGLTQ
ncbi:efflux RND transporter periplasmic adaptor subunit [Maribius pontilimi]|uniref:Efflux RND transporter periplasmic adaptor subunit n=1 Tax=Palleronia pontilimi TaxID=1964209 RepID=A0A934MCQ0_9RHOB|nr:efflux RND transporter periplasmic adaptor subunit [Palleronia pontilimi]MBJ3761506.1 efflux RND transporter periplasmic adaptor subunit [Palleronia pontilimi]